MSNDRASASRPTLSREVVLRKLKEKKRNEKPVESVLATLHDVFEEGEGDEFLGDPMWWRHIEDIDVDRIYIPGSIEYRQLKYMFWEAVFFILFLLIANTYVFELLTREAYEARNEQLRFWRGCEVDHLENVKCELDKVVDIKSFWNWLDESFIPQIFSPKADYDSDVATIQTTFPKNQFSISWSPRAIGNEKILLLLGTVRMRQLRVLKGQGCRVSSLFAHIFPTCRGTFEIANESRFEFASAKAPTYTLEHYRWSSTEETDQIDIEGEFAMYPGTGYKVDIPLFRTEAHTLLHDLKNCQWLDSMSRAVILEFSTLNTNVNQIINNRILFEFAPTGNVKIKHEVNAFPTYLLSFNTDSGQALWVFIYMFVLLLMILGKLVIMWWHLKQNGMKYFGYGWNIVDLAMILAFILHINFKYDVYSAVDAEPQLQAGNIGHPERFMPFTKAAKVSIENSKTLLSVLILLNWLQSFKYLCIVSYFRTLIRVIEKALHSLVVFSIVALIVFFAFAVAFYVGFGTSDERFATIWGTFLILFFYLVGGFELELANWFVPGATMIRPLIFLLYLLLTYFIIVNIFMAIVLDAYTMLVVIIGQRKNKSPMLAFLFTYYHQIRGIHLVEPETVDEDDKDFEICDLRDLPGVVAKKWITKKKQMIDTIRKVNGEIGTADDESNSARNTPNDDDSEEEMVAEERAPPTCGQAICGSLQRCKRNCCNACLPSSYKALQNLTKIPASKRSTLTTANLYNADDALNGQITRAQLQRLMEEDKAIRILLGTSKARDVIKKFKYFPPLQEGLIMTLDEDGNPVDRESDLDELELELDQEEEDEKTKTIHKLQETVFSRLEKLEKGGLDVDAVEVPQIRFISNQMADMFGDIQNSWREGITSVLESATVISGGLLNLTKGVEQVNSNHEDIMAKLDIDSSSSEDSEYDGEE